MPVRVLETQRLNLRRFAAGDAAFILRLVNEPSWLRHIGDRGVRTLEDAGAYIEDKLVDLYDRFGFGLFCVELKDGLTPVGMCGLIKRDSLDDIDLGFAFLAAHGGKGYALEAAAGVVEWAHESLGVHTLVAITSPANHRAHRLLQRLGFGYERTAQLPGIDEQRLYRRSHANGGDRPRDSARTMTGLPEFCTRTTPGQ